MGATLLTLAVLSVSQSAAVAAQSGLSTVVVASSLPGLVADPPGPFNGPITPSQLISLDPGATRSQQRQTEQEMGSRDITGYVRTWVVQPANGNGVVIDAFNVDGNLSVNTFLGLLIRSAANAGTAFPVPGVAGGTGFTLKSTASGAAMNVYEVMFGRGNTIFIVKCVTETGALTSADAVLVAQHQARNATGSVVDPISAAQIASGAAVALALGLLLLAAAIVGMILVGRRRRRSEKNIEAEFAGAEFAPGEYSPGWYPYEGNIYEQNYWDGDRWTSRLRWDGGAWVDLVQTV